MGSRQGGSSGMSGHVRYSLTAEVKSDRELHCDRPAVNVILVAR